MYEGRPLTVIIAAGGIGRRFGADEPKQFLDIGGKAMITVAAEPFLKSGYTDEIIFVVPDGYVEQSRRALLQVFHGAYDVPINVVSGGLNRTASVSAGLQAAAAYNRADGLVLIHDAARPFVKPALIERVLEAASAHGAAVPAIPVSDTVYIVDEDGYAERGSDRDRLRAVQTPQGFLFERIKNAHERVLSADLVVTDDGTAVLADGGRVALVEGDHTNIKITRQQDLKADGAFCRVGIGIDAHRFEQGRELILGGLAIPFEKGLAGHSDADVLTHALMDAILGAMREGDIGVLFPDSDPAYAGISSLALLGDVVLLMKKRGYELVNADMTLVAERPRMSPYRADIEFLLAKALGTAAENVSLKATTTEKLGFTGREEGIAAEAVVLLKKKDAMEGEEDL